MQYISLIILAFAVSLDSFSVGFTYGLRKMIIPMKSILIIAICSALTLSAAMTIGHIIESFLPSQWTESIGGFILIALGFWIIIQFFRPTRGKEEELLHEKMIANIEFQSLGIVIKILKKPLSADFDRSGTITGVEAYILGLALSLDSFGAGIGAAMLGYSPLYLAICVAVMSSIFILTGLKSGVVLSKYIWLQKFSFIPGLVLILIGFLKI